MDKLIVELTGAHIENAATPRDRTSVRVTIENSTGRLSVENREGSPWSVHRFTVREAADLGVGGTYNLNPEEAARVLAVSCSLANRHILFSFPPLQARGDFAWLERAEAPSIPEIFETDRGSAINLQETLRHTGSAETVLISPCKLDEARVFDIAGKLLGTRMFDKANRSLWQLDVPQLNILDSIESYIEALRHPDGLSCYESLYIAFEKAVNADARNRTGEDLDREAQRVTLLAETDIRCLRKMNDRVKHALRNREDIGTLKSLKAQLPQLRLQLKQAADHAILARINSLF